MNIFNSQITIPYKRKIVTHHHDGSLFLFHKTAEHHCDVLVLGCDPLVNEIAALVLSRNGMSVTVAIPSKGLFCPAGHNRDFGIIEASAYKMLWPEADRNGWVSHSVRRHIHKELTASNKANTTSAYFLTKSELEFIKKTSHYIFKPTSTLISKSDIVYAGAGRRKGGCTTGMPKIKFPSNPGVNCILKAKHVVLTTPHPTLPGTDKNIINIGDAIEDVHSNTLPVIARLGHIYGAVKIASFINNLAAYQHYLTMAPEKIQIRKKETGVVI